MGVLVVVSELALVGWRSGTGPRSGAGTGIGLGWVRLGGRWWWCRALRSGPRVGARGIGRGGGVGGGVECGAERCEIPAAGVGMTEIGNGSGAGPRSEAGTGIGLGWVRLGGRFVAWGGRCSGPRVGARGIGGGRGSSGLGTSEVSLGVVLNTAGFPRRVWE